MRKLVIIPLFLLSHCTSTPVQKFKQVKVGMTKGDVVEIMGPPASTSRRGGLLKWYYYLKPEDKRSRRVMYFDTGILTYKGQVIPPPITAEEAEVLKTPKAKPSRRTKSFKRSVSDEKLRRMIKKDIKRKKAKKKKKSKETFEEI